MCLRPVPVSSTFKIAVFEPLSGPLKYLGDLSVASLKFHADEYNEKGGLLGKQIEILAFDSQMKPDVANKLATKAILENKVNAIGTGVGSPNGLRTCPVHPTNRFGPQRSSNPATRRSPR